MVAHPLATDGKLWRLAPDLVPDTPIYAATRESEGSGTFATELVEQVREAVAAAPRAAAAALLSAERQKHLQAAVENRSKDWHGVFKSFYLLEVPLDARPSGFLFTQEFGDAQHPPYPPEDPRNRAQFAEPQKRAWAGLPAARAWR